MWQALHFLNIFSPFSIEALAKSVEIGSENISFFVLIKTLLLNSVGNLLFVIEDFKNEIKKTKLFNKFLEKNKLINSLIISDKNSKSKIFKSARNIPNLKIIEQEGTNAYDLLKYKNVIFTTTSIKSFQDRVTKWKNFII